MTLEIDWQVLLVIAATALALGSFGTLAALRGPLMNNLIASTSGHPRARPAGPLEIPPVFLAIRSTPRGAPQRRSGQVIHERALILARFHVGCAALFIAAIVGSLSLVFDLPSSSWATGAAQLAVASVAMLSGALGARLLAQRYVPALRPRSDDERAPFRAGAITRCIDVSSARSPIFVLDESVGVAPELADAPVSSSESCVVLAAPADAGDRVRLTLTNEEPDSDGRHEVVFDGQLPTPSGRLSARVGEHASVDIPVDAERSRVRVLHRASSDGRSVVVRVGS